MQPEAAVSIPRPLPKHPHLARVAAASRWTLAILACLWMGLCTAVGPLYWQEGSLADWSWLNTAYFLLSTAIYFGLIVALVRYAGHTKSASRRKQTADSKRTSGKTGGADDTSTAAQLHAQVPVSVQPTKQQATHTSRVRERLLFVWTVIRRGLRIAFTTAGRWITRATNRTWKIALILFIGWLWAPTTLLAAFGADIRSQIREFSWAWNQWTGLEQPYIGFFSFVPMDIYPTAHYLWPDNPTYLTDQHNVVLTVYYGATAAFSRYLTGSNDAGIVVLAATQMLFAVFCCAAAANRFLNLPWNTSQSPAGGLARFLILLFFLICPLAVFSTISITKSPLFAFAFVWWFSIWYELRCTWSKATHAPKRLPRHSMIAFILSTCVMLIAAKYAWYIIALQIVLALIADRRRWGTYVVALLIPTVLIHGGIVYAINSGAIIGGDPIESRGVQLQMIARVAARNPDGISQEARDALEPVFNLDQMADAYFQQDADPVKSSGIQSKKVSYKWRSVTPEDMENFNKAWIEIVKDNPVIAIDALLAKCFGYFNVTDHPYVAMDYYVNSDYVQKNSTWIKSYNHEWREKVAQFADDWGHIPVLGWFTHGNFYVVLTLIIGAAEVIRRRWLTLVTHMPLLLLMGVMITAPANNFERHMLPVAFVFGFVALTFWRESKAERAQSAARLEA
ncbi:DUF6020 family protein [Bifidobacterium oedipodis]|nr:DUF6020 family protein [Bifidobacterium sp. DSM 109957]